MVLTDQSTTHGDTFKTEITQKVTLNSNIASFSCLLMLGKSKTGGIVAMVKKIFFWREKKRIFLLILGVLLIIGSVVNCPGTGTVFAYSLYRQKSTSIVM